MITFVKFFEKMQKYTNPSLIVESSKVDADKIAWSCPSNIALVKYWGKHGLQLPRNPSISFTLDKACTKTSISYSTKERNEISFDFYFHGEKRDEFKPKIQALLNNILPVFPFLNQLHLTIESENTFPHSAGIASSASSMGALALCLCSMEKMLFNNSLSEEEFLQKASFIARIGSGSACRSIYPSASLWGEFAEVSESNELFGIPCHEMLNPVFHTFHDDILIVSKEEKSVSSTAGHNLMEGNIYANNRYLQAKTRLHYLLSALKTGDLDEFGKITEDEALTLHALMMTSNPSFLLLRPATLTIIEKIRQFRMSTKTPVYFTLDAGPNVHLLYPQNNFNEVRDFIQNELSQFCENNMIINDNIGCGPMILH
jgi:diphosphomevalonate decarboxylase